VLFRSVNVKTFGVDLGDGLYGQDDASSTFTIGDEVIATADDATKQLTVRRNGQVIKTMPISIGKNKTPTPNGTYTIGDGAVLNIGRDFVVGRESGTGTLTMTGGTITKTGDEKFLVGHNNGVGVVAQSGGTISVNNELYIGNENAGASGTYTLSGTGALSVANEVVVAESLLARASALAADIAAGPRTAVQVTKQLVDAAASGAPPAILDALAAGFVSGTDDLAEGVAAFHEKRPPRFNRD
jgi:1,4-dihydroxy-2-naphthoyl-CoA synthase